MSSDERMTINERRKLLKKMQKRYKAGDRQEKQRLLDEMEALTELHRKSLIRLMNSDLGRQPRQRQRGRTYGPEVASALGVIAMSLDYVCAERLQPNLVVMAEHLVRHGELTTTPDLLEQLGKISVSTVRRLLDEQHQHEDRVRLPQRRAARANRLRREIPAERIPWDETEPGHFEVDLVHHCGVSASGNYVHTLQMIDVATGWSERVAVLGRSYRVMRDGFERILARLPFDVREIHPDNGSEFLNDHLVRFWKDAVQGVHLSRSRPWQKNDNRFVEQKNDTLVRAFLGYDRLDTIAQTIMLNDLYDKMWLYYNGFQPVMRLAEKTVVPAQRRRGSSIKRRFDQARTPFDRLCDTDALSPDQQAAFANLRLATNPVQLRQDIYAQLHNLFSLPLAEPDTTQDVFLTLFNPPQILKGEADTPVTFSNERTMPVR